MTEASEPRGDVSKITGTDEVQDDRPVVYRGRAAQVDLHLLPAREDGLLHIRGRLVARARRSQKVAGVSVELYTLGGRVAGATTDRSGAFEFPGLSPTVYHLRLGGDGWTLSVLGITG